MFMVFVNIRVIYLSIMILDLHSINIVEQKCFCTKYGGVESYEMIHRRKQVRGG